MNAALIATLLAAASTFASAQTTSSAPPAQPATPSAMSTPMVDGEVRKIDKEARKLTLRHGPIPHLDMPAMTMVFQTMDAALLDRVKVGDRVRFTAEGADGRYTVTDIQPAQ